MSAGYLQKLLKFMPIAQSVAALSKDPNTKVGAVALDENYNIIATGYNGIPRGVEDAPERLQRPEKYRWVSHAEENLVAQAAYGGRSLKGATVLVTSLFPCNACARMLIQAGVKRVIAPKIENGRWAEVNEMAMRMFAEAGVEVIEYGREDD